MASSVGTSPAERLFSVLHEAGAFPAPDARPTPPSPLGPGLSDAEAARQILENFLPGMKLPQGPPAARGPPAAAFMPSAAEKFHPAARGPPAPTFRPSAAEKLHPFGLDSDPAAAESDAARDRILGLLQGMGQPKDNPNTARATTLEYRGQWQPKPNGAMTGHGEVPQEWAIEVASENDRALAKFAAAGGAQLCLSNAFGQSNQMEAQAQDLIDSGKCTEDDAAVNCIRSIARATEEREALMRRQWCDIDFQEGEETNKELLKHLERDFASQLASVATKQRKDEARRTGASKEAGELAQAWYNIKVGSGAGGKVYLSAKFSGDGIDVYGHDDESGRQRWQIEPSETGEDWFRLRLLGGTPLGRRLLSRGAGLRLELCEFDDSSGRQRWHLKAGCDGKSAAILPAVGAGDPGVAAAAGIEAAARGQRLSHTLDGTVVLEAADSGNERQHWLIPGWPGFSPEATTAPSSRSNRADDVVQIAIHSGEVGAMSLTDLSREEMTRVISNNRSLGTAIDLVGVYLKNYEIDKADRLCSRIMPLVRERGGVWLFKALNFFTTVRMKQSRYEEALEMYREYETLIGFSPEAAWELFDTVYRNFGWIYTSLHEYGRALEYFEKSVEVKRSNGIQAHWFDQWDLGKTHARLSLQNARWSELELALRLIKEGLEMHRRAEPKDVIMRCKMLNSAGECATIRGDFLEDLKQAESWYDDGIALHQESYDLYMKVLGPTKPLTGWAMEDLAGALLKRGRREEAKEMLHGALAVECSKDIIKLSSMARLLDSVLEVHSSTSDSDGLSRCQDAINTGLDNLRMRRVDVTERASYAALSGKIAQVLITQGEANREVAIGVLTEAIRHVRSDDASASAAARNCRIPGVDSGEERERFAVPRAGGQGMDVDEREVLSALESQLSLLRSGVNNLSREDVDCEVLPPVDQDAPFVPSKVAGPAASVMQPCPTFFEQVDDFEIVD